MNQSIKWAAALSHVREVSLLGVADLAYWAARLKREDVVPRERDGRAQIMIVGASSKFMGLRFSEISISVLTRSSGEATQGHEAFLVGAFNSRRFFAFCERVFFSTPYSHADVEVYAARPGLRIGRKGQIAFTAEMAPGAARGHNAAPAEDGWVGRVLLPNNGSAERAKCFFARLAGRTERYAFMPLDDSIKIKSVESADALAGLIESNFVPQEWVVRADATHSKSKTYLRREAALISPMAH